MTVEERLEELRSMVLLLVERQQAREWYTTEEFSRLAGRAEFTVREWARRGRIRAQKKDSGRGKHTGYAISHEEWLRFQREGLLPAS